MVGGAAVDLDQAVAFIDDRGQSHSDVIATKTAIQNGGVKADFAVVVQRAVASIVEVALYTAARAMDQRIVGEGEGIAPIDHQVVGPGVLPEADGGTVAEGDSGVTQRTCVIEVEHRPA